MNRLLTALVAAAALWAAACSSGSGNIQPPPPTGNFSASDLHGTYAFMTSGEVLTNGSSTASLLERVGSFVANGTGGITGGIEDVNSQGIPSGAQVITGGAYTVNADGRGTLTLQFATNTLTFGIVLTSSSTGNGLMIDETTFSTVSSQASIGSGNFVKQDTNLCSSPNTSVVGTYVFDFSGLDASGVAESFVGEFTSTSGGTTTSSFADMNDGGSSAGPVKGPFAAPATFGTGGANSAGPNACGRGLAQITTSVTGTQTYAYYVVDSKRVRFINAAGGEMLSGDAVLQDNTIPTNVNSISGGLAFLVAGSTGVGGLTRLVRVTATNGALSNVLMDTNEVGQQPTPTTGATQASITLDPSNPGRGVITFVGTGQSVNVPSRFVFYLNSATQGVIQETTQNINTGAVVDVADGAIDAQSGSPFTSSNISGTYAMNWSGLVTAGGNQANTDEEDLVGQVTISSLALKGTSDVFDFTSTTLIPNTGIGTAGQINLNGGDGTGGDGKTRVNMTVKLSNNSPIQTVVYVVNPQLAFFAISPQNGGASHTVAGVLQAQQ